MTLLKVVGDLHRFGDQVGSRIESLWLVVFKHFLGTLTIQLFDTIWECTLLCFFWGTHYFGQPTSNT